jgi:Rrf2 family transcriptional regulator, cysteine metabolism repressor
MFISTKTRYGFRFMVNLGLRYGNGVVQIKEVAAKEKISIKYLEHIASILKLSGLIKVERGAKGGYYLSRAPENISLREVMEVLEGSLQLIECSNPEYICELRDQCVMTDFWQKLSDHIKNYLEPMTLNDLLVSYKSKNKDLMFYI